MSGSYPILVHDNGLRVKHNASVPDAYLRFKKLMKGHMKSILNIRLRWMTGLLFFVAGTAPLTMTRAAEETPTVLAVAACDSFAEIREQCAWLGGLIGFPVLGGLPDTYAMMATGGKGLQGLDTTRPIGVVVSAQEDAAVIHGFLPATDAKVLIETLADIPFRGMVDMIEAGEWVVLTPQGQPVTMDQPLDMLTSITSYLSVGVKVFPSRLPETLKDSLLDSAEQSLGSAEDPIPQQFYFALPLPDVFDEETVRKSVAQTEALLFGLAIEKKTDRIFLESRTIFTEEGTAGAFWSRAGEVNPSLSLPSQVGQYAMQLQIAQSLNDATQLKDLEEGLLGGLKQIKPAQLGAFIQKVSAVVLPQILESGAFELVGGVAPPDNVEGEQTLPSVGVGIGIADGNALVEQLKGLVTEADAIPANISVEFDVAEDEGFSFHDIVMMPLGRVTLAISEKCIYAMTRFTADEREYKAVSSEPTSGFQPIAAATVQLESLFDGVAGLPPEMSIIVEDIKPRGELNLLIRPITRGLAIRLTADGEAVQTGAALGTRASALMPRNTVIGD